MTLQVTQQAVQAGVTPSALTPAASDTIAEASFGPNGLNARVITTGTATDFAVTDPNTTPLGYTGTATVVSCPATGVRVISIPRGAINQATGLATVTFSGARTGVTYELYRV
jgi:hypothetical protein